MCNGEKPGTIVLIMKMESEVGPLLLCCCMKFLTPNYFGERISANPVSSIDEYLRTRNRIDKIIVYRRERKSGKTLGRNYPFYVTTK